MYFECVWLLYCRFFDCFSVICNKTFYKVYTLFSHTHLTTLSQLFAVGGVTGQLWSAGGQSSRSHEVEDIFGGLVEASFSTPLGRVGFLKVFVVRIIYTIRFVSE